MTASIYLTSAEGRSGKSAVALGVLDAMLADGSRVGVFRPLFRGGGDRDRVLELLRSRASADVPYDACIGVSYEEARDDPEAALGRIVEAYEALKARCDWVVVVGSDFTDVAVPTELAFNARIAANLDTPVLLIVGGRLHDGPETLGQSTPRTARELAQVAEMGAEELAAAHAPVLAVVVNRADPEALDEIVAEVGAALPAGTPVWAVPEEVTLVAPSLASVADAVSGSLTRGDAALLDREVRQMVITGMSMENVLPRLLEGSAVVIAADRAETLLAVTMAHEAPTFPSLAGVVLNGAFELSPDVERLLDGIGSPLPVIRTELGTFDTAQRMIRSRGLLSAEHPERIGTALRLFGERVDTAELRERTSAYRGGVRTPIRFAYELRVRAGETGARIVLPESGDDRVLRAADTVLRRGIARIVLLGDERIVRERATALGLVLDAAEIVDPATSPLREPLVVECARLRQHKGVTIDQAFEQLADANTFATMMVQQGHADGMVSGAAHTTAQTIRPALQLIGTEPGVSVVSSVFFMALADRVLVYGDCAVNPDPSAEQLADIAFSSAATATRFGVEPRIAMLSYSTGESGAGVDVDKVRLATELVRAAHPGLEVDGPIQYDAAYDPVTGAAKLPGSAVAGRATVFIFPDLNTGNNTYKAVQRSAGAVAVGPVLQGLARPVNDLSRGATVEDIVNTIAITAIQAGPR
ncbi:MAG: phosphate acetyltransferase [Leucobacter sp.]